MEIASALQTKRWSWVLYLQKYIAFVFSWLADVGLINKQRVLLTLHAFTSGVVPHRKKMLKMHSFVSFLCINVCARPSFPCFHLVITSDPCICSIIYTNKYIFTYICWLASSLEPSVLKLGLSSFIKRVGNMGSSSFVHFTKQVQTSS